ncbi:MAG: FkbM family methyltransferase [Puniceicoccaceae bacterium]
MIARIIRQLERLIGQRVDRVDLEIQRLKHLPRYEEGSTRLLGPALRFVDAASFLFLYDELFRKEIYQFETSNPCPYIIDGGANIGLSVCYFKRCFPEASVVAFEPDPKVFAVLKDNVEMLGLNHVELVQKGLWNEDKTLEFHAEGADGGRIAVSGDSESLKQIETVRLRSYLDRPVDLLKIDIEGAETEVLEDCADLLQCVDRIFVEYHSFTHQPQNLHRLLSVLVNAGFRYNIQHIGVISPHPFVKVQSYLGMDNQLNIFAVKESPRTPTT